MRNAGSAISEAELTNLCASDINREVYERLKKYTDDQDLLFASLIHNPFGNTDLAANKELLDKNVKLILTNLNRVQEMDSEIFSSFKKSKKSVVLFFVNCSVILDRPDQAKTAKKWLNKKRAAYASKLLEKLDVSEIKYDLEDKFFKIIEPVVFDNYVSLLKYTKKQYLLSQKKYLDHFRQLLAMNSVDAEIETRLKTIYSIHQKIVKKNILFSQVLDTIGLRIITNTVEDCYRAMGIVLNNFPSLTGRIKDYIAIPKENGYRSIHLTIIHKGHPTEIQIRTWAMHEQAQYGKAGHASYKTLRA